MDFFKQAEQFASSQGGNTNNQGAIPQSAQPGTGQAPSDSQMLDSAKLLYGAATGQQVDHQQLAGAAGDLLGGLSAHGNIDQGQYGTYVNQAEQYLDKYSGENQGAGGAPGGAPGGASAPGAANPSANPSQGANNPSAAQGTDDSSGYGAGGGGGGQGTDDSSGYGGAGGGQGTNDSSGYGAGGGGGGQGGDGYGGAGGGQGTGGSSW